MNKGASVRAHHVAVEDVVDRMLRECDEEERFLRSEHMRVLGARAVFPDTVVEEAIELEESA